MGKTALIRPANDGVATAPTTCEVTEKIVREWLRREMSMTIQAIDYDAPLVDLGIDSLGRHVNGSAELEDAFEKRMNPEVFFELDTIRELAAHLDTLAEVFGTKFRRRWFYC